MSEDWSLRADAVSVSYPGRVILRSVSLQLQSGRSTAIVGPSGSGKTTLLAVLGGLRPPNSGSVQLRDPLGDLKPVGAHASWILQTTNALGRRTVLENILLGSLLDQRSDRYRTKRAMQAIKDVGLASVAEAPARTLSGGETQRMAIARALVAERPFVLADEPTGQLDRVTTEHVLDRLFANPVLGLVVATHDPQVWERCDRIIRIDELVCADIPLRG
ncbi:ATP-binding cassette domain-containing protein [Blastococcus sp. KM273128]|uniref:ABC transporter ATP-binding protein n=1 Tax=Blastococcus sp. KM273128 TaxID=2570314 RepID=UPI0035AB70C0|nr:ATP-binding cassette domain-containing protein [Blastococcus sp. KM273128]